MALGDLEPAPRRTFAFLIEAEGDIDLGQQERGLIILGAYFDRSFEQARRLFQPPAGKAVAGKEVVGFKQARVQT